MSYLHGVIIPGTQFRINRLNLKRMNMISNEEGICNVYFLIPFAATSGVAYRVHFRNL